MPSTHRSTDPLRCCRSYGASGMLRLADQRYRPCLDCLGQGCLPRIFNGAVPSSASR